MPGFTYPNSNTPGTGSYSLGAFGPDKSLIGWVDCGSHPFITGVIVTSGSELAVTFPQLARYVKVTNELLPGSNRSGTLEVSPCPNSPVGQLNVTSSNVIAGQHFVPLVATSAPYQSEEFKVPLAAIYLNCSGTAGATCFARVKAYLTPLSSSFAPFLSGSGMTA